MWKFLLLLGCIACLAEAGHHNDRHRESRKRERNLIIENRGKIVIIVNNGRDESTKDSRSITARDNILERLGYTQNLQDATTDMETLLQQKFILDILFNVRTELRDEKLIELGQTLIVDESKYTGRIDADMLNLLQLCINGQMLSKTDKFNVLNSEHLRQMQGLYKLLQQATDWDTFQRLVCFARLHLNDELLVNSLLLALKERPDARHLILPSITEILPDLFYDDQLIAKVKDIDLTQLIGNTNTMKSNWRDSTDINKEKPLQTATSWSAKPKKTWQEWKQEKMLKQNGLIENNLNTEDKIVLLMPKRD